MIDQKAGINGFQSLSQVLEWHWYKGAARLCHRYATDSSTATVRYDWCNGGDGAYFISSALVHMDHFAAFSCYVDISCLWEATKIKGHDENAWTWRWSVLDDNIFIFSFSLFCLHTRFYGIRLSHRVADLQVYCIQHTVYVLFHLYIPADFICFSYGNIIFTC